MEGDREAVQFKIEDKELALWREILKGAETELLNTEDVYFKNKKFNEAIVKLASNRIKDLEDEGNKKSTNTA